MKTTFSKAVALMFTIWLLQPTRADTNGLSRVQRPEGLSEAEISELMSNYLAQVCPEGPRCQRHQYLLEAVRSNEVVLAEIRRTEEKEKYVTGKVPDLLHVIRNIKAEYGRLHPTEEHLATMREWLRGYRPPRTWPEPAKREEILSRSMVMMRQAIDTNQIELACVRMTTDSTGAEELREVARLAHVQLEEFAAVLSNPGFETQMSGSYGPGCIGKLTTSTNEFTMFFNPIGGFITQVNKRQVPSGELVAQAIFFHETGKLKSLHVKHPNGQGGLTGEILLILNEDGTVSLYRIRTPKSEE